MLNQRGEITAEVFLKFLLVRVVIGSNRPIGNGDEFLKKSNDSLRGEALSRAHHHCFAELLRDLFIQQ